jgi:tRNA(Ile)-lysidine synthase
LKTENRKPKTENRLPTVRFPSQVLSFIQAQQLFQPQDRILVGVSGGPDSMALLYLLSRWQTELELTLGVAHFQHGLRGQESEAEAAFVTRQAAALGLPLYLDGGDVRGFAKLHKISLQVAARRLRLAFFARWRQEQGYAKLALGHTADDQVELFFLRLLRGAGPEGLKGMWPRSPGGVVRPLMNSTKNAILSWLEQENLPYCLDSSNFQRHYQRNRVRLELLPELTQHYNPQLPQAIRRTQVLLQEQESYLAQETARLLAEICSNCRPGKLHLKLAPLLKLHPYLQKRVLRLALEQAGEEDLADLSYRHVEAALNLSCSPYPSGEISLPGNWRLIRRGGELQLRLGNQETAPAEEFILPSQENGTFSARGWTLNWTTYPVPLLDIPLSPLQNASGHADVTANGSRLTTHCLIDRHQVQFPLSLRSLQPGDRFQPLGMRGHKKLQDFLVDAKIPRQQRQAISLLVSHDRIIWVVGYRLADPVKITPLTTNILQITAYRELDRMI